MRRTSDTTKAMILTAARERFARDGYERTTIRAVAADAQIDPSMVMRYYGNKANLFSEASAVDLELPELPDVPKSRVGRMLAAHFVDRWEDDESLKVLLRTAVTNAEAATRMRSIFAEQVLPLAMRLTDDHRAAEIRASLAASQILGIALCRYVLQFPPVVSMSRGDLVDHIGPTLQRYLTKG
jgi:AcrR family transcriptional regulator